MFYRIIGKATISALLRIRRPLHHSTIRTDTTIDVETVNCVVIDAIVFAGTRNMHLISCPSLFSPSRSLSLFC
jgi:hypothetical protein